MEYELSQHAKDVMAEREIAHEWVDRVLENPAKVEPDPIDDEVEHRLGRISEYGNRVLRVILKPSPKPARIVTVYFDRAMRTEL